LNVYVESNFVLELALAQEQHGSCEVLLRLAEEEQVRIILPAYSLAEPYETLKRRHLGRSEVKTTLDKEIRQLSRSANYALQVRDFGTVTSLLIDSGREEIQRLEATRARLLRRAEIIPFDSSILRSSSDLQAAYDLDPQDAIIFASILLHLARAESIMPSCFLSRDKDFEDPDLVERLGRHGCKLLFRFDHGVGYVQSRLSR
jgi:predicted nucleic acid-binding protein